jgi:FKBP-type peptidyl-prolyl cis-trans isomerase FkpA
MKKWFFLCALTTLAFSACKKNKNCTAAPVTKVATTSEIAALQNYLTVNNITNANQQNGVFYVINPQGAGESPNLCSTITAEYAGNLLNMSTNTLGTQFDFSKPGLPLVISLQNLIAGWQVTLPLVKAGGSVTLYIPPSLGYGAPGSGTAIPPNSYLRFTINLLDVQ